MQFTTTQEHDCEGVYTAKNPFTKSKGFLKQTILDGVQKRPRKSAVDRTVRSPLPDRVSKLKRTCQRETPLKKSTRIPLTTLANENNDENVENDIFLTTQKFENGESRSPHFLQAARATSLDFVFLDTEHVPLDRHQLSWMCRAYDAAGIAPIVRVPSVLDASGSVTSVLDGGAVGVVSPYTETLDQVLALVGMSKLRPLKGSTLQLALGILKQQAHKNHALAEQSTGASTPGYVDPLPFLSELLPVETLACMRKENDGTVLFLNIESTLGMSNLSLLLSVPGVDGVFVGPKDLSVQLGVPEQWESDTFVNACDTIVKITVRRGLSVGNHYSFDHAVEYQNHWRTLGANLVVHSTDMKLFQNALLADFEQLRGDRTRGEGGGTAVADV